MLKENAAFIARPNKKYRSLILLDDFQEKVCKDKVRERIVGVRPAYRHSSNLLVVTGVKVISLLVTNQSGVLLWSACSLLLLPGGDFCICQIAQGTDSILSIDLEKE